MPTVIHAVSCHPTKAIPESYPELSGIACFMIVTATSLAVARVFEWKEHKDVGSLWNPGC